MKIFTPELSRILLAWWELHGRKDPALKPWMFTPDGRWPRADTCLDPYGIWVAEVMRCSAASPQPGSNGSIPSMALAYSYQ
jgi:adenine-specific DNA glycosylase